MKVEPYNIVTDGAGVTLVNESTQFRQFLIDNPFIGMDGKGRFVWYVFADEETLRGTKKSIEKKLLIPGVNKFCFNLIEDQ